MKCFLFTLTAFLSLSATAQHYYKDIVGTKETTALLQLYRQHKVGRVAISSFNDKGVRIEDFSVTQTFDGSQLVTTTSSGLNAASVLTSVIDANNRVVRTKDSNIRMSTNTEYQYNEAGLLARVWSSSTDSAERSVQTEEHLWQWAGNQPVRLLRIKNKKDSSYIELKRDEQGNVVEEQETRRGQRSEPVYYYYNDNNQLTDVVAYNKKARRLLPEYMFEYNGAGQTIQRITVPSGGDNYLIWRYQYNQQGLKTKEVVYNKQKQLTGKVEYQYSFRQ